MYDPEKAYNGYVLISLEGFDSMHGFISPPAEYYKSGPNFAEGKAAATNPEFMHTEVYLMDMNGNIINEWAQKGSNKKVKLLPDGHILSMSEQSKEVLEYDWDAERVWNYKTNLGPHHYHARLENGNTLILCFEKVDPALNRNIVNETTMEYGLIDRRSLELEGDTIIEVTPEGKIVWSWLSTDHLDLNRYNPAIVDMTDWTHGNTASIIPENKWYDAGDTRFKPGNIMYNPRHFNQFFIIDKDSGKIVWESPKDFNHFGGFANLHEPNMIPKGYPGEGNIMLFDNGLSPRKWTHDGSTIAYEIQPDTFEVVWRYQGQSDRFHSKVKGSVYKLPNGNVLISEDVGGRTFQVRPDASFPEGGEIVWEYQTPAGVARTSMYAYDYAPQLAALPKPKEMKVTGLDPIYFSVLPDELREDGKVVSYTPGEPVIQTSKPPATPERSTTRDYAY